MQFDFVISAATAFASVAFCFSSVATRFASPGTRGSLAADVPCAIGTTIATSARTNRSHGSLLACLIDLPLLSRNASTESGDYAFQSGLSSVGSAAAHASDVVREPDEEEHQHEREADHRHALVDVPPDGASADALHERERDVPAVEREERKQVEEGEREAEVRQEPEVRLPALVQRLGRSLDDPDRARDLLAVLPVYDPR